MIARSNRWPATAALAGFALILAGSHETCHVDTTRELGIGVPCIGAECAAGRQQAPPKVLKMLVNRVVFSCLTEEGEEDPPPTCSGEPGAGESDFLVDWHYYDPKNLTFDTPYAFAVNLYTATELMGNHTEFVAYGVHSPHPIAMSFSNKKWTADPVQEPFFGPWTLESSTSAGTITTNPRYSETIAGTPTLIHEDVTYLRSPRHIFEVSPAPIPQDRRVWGIELQLVRINDLGYPDAFYRLVEQRRDFPAAGSSSRFELLGETVARLLSLGDLTLLTACLYLGVHAPTRLGDAFFSNEGFAVRAEEVCFELD